MGLPSSSRDALAWHTAMGITPIWVTLWFHVGCMVVRYGVGGWDIVCLICFEVDWSY